MHGFVKRGDYHGLKVGFYGRLHEWIYRFPGSDGVVCSHKSGGHGGLTTSTGLVVYWTVTR